jgi:oxygen-independent coproporphyrinogen-3 oxidase
MSSNAKATLDDLPTDLLTRWDRPVPRYTSYPTAADFRPLTEDEALAALARADAAPDRPLGLYVHVPFCQEMCTYCGCNVVVRRDAASAERWLDIVLAEIAQTASHLPQRRRVASLHLGGGTPNFLSSAQFERLVGTLQETFDFSTLEEFAVELDPRTVAEEQIETLVRLGLNRASIGVQDLDEDVQEAIGRHQSLEQTTRAFRSLRDRGVGSINVDLVYGLPRQTLDSFAATIDAILALRPNRLAVFGYAHLPRLRPLQRKIEESELPDTAARAELFRLAAVRFLAAGYVHVGLDHFVLPDDEMAVALAEDRLDRNFQGYVVRRGEDLLGFGPSAIGDVGGTLMQNHKALGAWMKAVREGHLPVSRGWVRSAEDLRRDGIIRQVMCGHAVHLDPQRDAAELARLAPLVADDLCRIDDDGMLRVTPRGRVLVRHVAAVFDGFRQGSGDGPTFSRAV